MPAELQELAATLPNLKDIATGKVTKLDGTGDDDQPERGERREERGAPATVRRDDRRHEEEDDDSAGLDDLAF